MISLVIRLIHCYGFSLLGGFQFDIPILYIILLKSPWYLSSVRLFEPYKRYNLANEKFSQIVRVLKAM